MNEKKLLLLRTLWFAKELAKIAGDIKESKNIFQIINAIFEEEREEVYFRNSIVIKNIFKKSEKWIRNPKFEAEKEYLRLQKQFLHLLEKHKCISI